VFVPGKPFQSSLMFASKPGAYLSEARFRLSSLRLEIWPYPQTLD